MVNWPKLIIAILFCESAGFIGSLFTQSSVGTWYQTLKKPPLNPPDWIFAPVWTALFCLMGVSAYIVWEKGLDNRPVRAALMIFCLQLVLNSLWSVLFFGLKSPQYAFYEIFLLWAAIVATIWKFWPISPWAGALLLPYILWVSFAVYLNFSIYHLNR